MKALEGLRVIDFTQAMAAPFGTMNLADMGADIIKIEPPVTGEPTRELSSVTQNGHSATFMTMNRSKRGLTADLKAPEGVLIVKRLAKTADVFVQNYRPGVAERLGLGYEALSEVNPRLIYCSVSGFGGTGPYAARGGYDLIAQGMSGIISVTGDEDAPAKSGVPLSDLCAGLFAAYGILCALEYRERTGLGQLVDTSLLEAAMALTVWESTEYWVTGQAPRPLGSAHRLTAPYQAVGRRTGTSTSARTTTSCSWGCAGRSAGRILRDDARFATSALRMEHRAALIEAIEKTTAGEPSAHWLGHLEHAGVPSGPINTYAEALADPHALARQMVVELVHPGAGPIKALGIPVKLSDTPGAVDRPAPLLGQHTADILAEPGYTDAEQQRPHGTGRHLGRIVRERAPERGADAAAMRSIGRADRMSGRRRLSRSSSSSSRRTSRASSPLTIRAGRSRRAKPAARRQHGPRRVSRPSGRQPLLRDRADRRALLLVFPIGRRSWPSRWCMCSTRRAWRSPTGRSSG